MSCARTLLVVLLLLTWPLGDVLAQRGRSYSSGGRSSSPSRPSSGGRSSSPSWGGGSGSGRSFPAPPSGWGTNRSPTPFPSSPHGRSYTNRPSSPPPSVPNFPSNKSSPSPPSNDPPSSRPPAPYSGTQPGDPGFDRGAAEAQRRAESKRRYTQGENPKPNYTDPTGKPQTIDPRDRTIDDLRKKLDNERWQNRDRRREWEFGPYINRPPIIIYRDPFSSWFWYWLLAQSLDTRSTWVYHHRPQMDDARYRDMVAKDPQLEERVKKLEEEKVQRDPTYAPPGVDTDLMYSDEYVDAAYNPKGPSLLGGLKFLLKTSLILAALAFFIWLVFFKRWGATTLPEKNQPTTPA